MLKFFSALLGRNRPPQHTSELYTAIVAQARKSDFYSLFGVPDTLDGRFDMVILHAFLVMRRLSKAGSEGAELNQALFDLMFADMDNSLREIGVGDLSVGKKVKQMAQAFYGRADAYETGITSAEPEALIQALARNLYGTTSPAAEQIEAMASYLRRADATLALQRNEEIIGGKPVFLPPAW